MLQMKLEDIQKGSYKHFMLKEICEQPEASTIIFPNRFNVTRTTIYNSTRKIR